MEKLPPITTSHLRETAAALCRGKPIDELECHPAYRAAERIEQLEKELAQLKKNRTGGGHESESSPWSVTDEKPWFAYSGNGILAFKTEAEATAQAEEFIEDWLDPDTGWDELVDQVFVGRAIQISSQVDRIDRPDESEIDEDGCDEDEHYWGGDYEYFCNYKLLPALNEEAKALRDVIGGYEEAGGE